MARLTASAAQKVAVLTFNRLGDENLQTSMTTSQHNQELHNFQKETSRQTNIKKMKVGHLAETNKSQETQNHLAVATEVSKLHFSTSMAEALAISDGLYCDSLACSLAY